MRAEVSKLTGSLLLVVDVVCSLNFCTNGWWIETASLLGSKRRGIGAVAATHPIRCHHVICGNASPGSSAPPALALTSGLLDSLTPEAPPRLHVGKPKDALRSEGGMACLVTLSVVNHQCRAGVSAPQPAEPPAPRPPPRHRHPAPSRFRPGVVHRRFPHQHHQHIHHTSHITQQLLHRTKILPFPQFFI